MGLKEAAENRINAFSLRHTQESVHTATGDIGRVVKINVIRGTVTIKANNKGIIVIPGSDVAPLDEFMSIRTEG
ncbi:hypothetical protein HYT02_00280 [Candidatus Gottesmanbacteria bacterium]|nr:hypothetical protein [Candidatus Gottesmanbacteria bacterium]